MKTRLIILLVGLLPAIFVSSHAQGPLVLISGPAGNVTALDVEAAVQKFPFNERQARLSRPEEVKRIAEEVYVRRALTAQAEKAKVGDDPLLKAVMQVERERVLSDAQIFDIGKAAWPTDAVLAKAAEERYKANPKQFEMPAQMRARQIMLAKGEPGPARVAQRAAADTLRAELLTGANFAEMARRRSADSTTASGGGDWGYFPNGAILPALERALENLKPGEISEVVETDFGFHILKLEDRKPAGVRTFDEVRGMLIGQLRDEADRKAKAAVMESIRSGMKVQESAYDAVAKRFATANE